MTTAEAGNLFQEGRLDDAIDAAGDAVRARPAEAGPRMLLAELLAYAGNFERADAVLTATAAADPGTALVVAEFRQLVRAATARRQVLTEGRVPAFLGPPSETQARLLEALTALRAGDVTAAAAAAEVAEAARPWAAGRTPDGEFADCRDADDLWSGTFEVLTTNGKYFWVPTERVASLEFHAPRRPRDLLWRRCTMVVRDGPEGDVYLPALYDRSGEDDGTRLGRRTEWTETAPILGAGQRIFLIGEDGIPCQQLTRLEFA
ncbi:MAG: tetratricopeptide repeat protein [Conexibacteraceae bacterium]|nr:tetratricopeptide repeat protein [Conexibacteraceae bacterium]